ncbi:tRNA-splicing endonuclease subunit Sen54 [Aplochiton taeniatus]
MSEERVERLGNLVKAVWIPTDRVVELQSPAGKFWQTMGFSSQGKQCLNPEEALYLMECGNLQIFYRDLPLSIQEAYERFLSSKTVSLQQYQVFGHLKRLGYVVNRFDPSSVSSQYERQLNLPQSRDKADRQVKRKRSASPTSGETEKCALEKMMEERDSSETIPEKGRRSPALPSGSGKVRAAPEKDPSTSAAEGGQGRSWWGEETDPDSDLDQGQSPTLRCPRWDFRSICFPDLGSGRSRSTSLASPDSSLLPGALTVGTCDFAPWLERLNLREVRMSRGERDREWERDRYRRDVNSDREVRRCRNWAEYSKLKERRSRRSHGDRPAHLWEGPVTPLHEPGQTTSTGALLNKISVVKSSRLLDGASSMKGSGVWRICFNVYQPDSVAEFKKSCPGKPYSRMCVCSFDGPVPDLRTLKQLAFCSGDIPVTYAVVDHGDVSFYTFKDFQLPTDVSL